MLFLGFPGEGKWGAGKGAERSRREQEEHTKKLYMDIHVLAVVYHTNFIIYYVLKSMYIN